MSTKSKELIQFLDELSRGLFGRSYSEALKANECVCCGGSADLFRGEIDRAEFDISGLCQECQDLVFKENDNYGNEE